MTDKARILFLCTGNSCRSQMAEGLCRHYMSEAFDPSSAGIEKHGLNPLAVKVMMEIGINISEYRSKTIEELQSSEFDYVVTVCDHANETCPFYPAESRMIHKSFDDPPKLSADAVNEEEALVHYRRVRDEIKEFILTELSMLTLNQ
jgi:arsenate reductase (thioredoxin)